MESIDLLNFEKDETEWNVGSIVAYRKTRQYSSAFSKESCESEITK